MVKKILIGLAILGGVFVITNPTPEDFKSYISSTEPIITLGNFRGTIKGEYWSYGRTDYFLCFSIYTVKYDASWDIQDGGNSNVNFGSKRYIGIFKNFFALKK